MAGLAKSIGRLTVLRVDNKEDFIKRFNESVPTQDFFDTCNTARSLFEDGGKETHSNLPS